MRGFQGCIVFSTFLYMAAAAPPAATMKRPAKGAATLPKAGIKTPGIQIPFSSLKAEAEFATPANPSWIAFSDSIWLPDAPKSSLDRIDPKSKKNDFLNPVAGVTQPCGGVISAFKHLWTLDCSSHTLVKLDAKAGKTAGTSAFGSDSVQGALAATSDSLWILTDSRTTISRVDPEQNTVVAETRLPSGCRSLLSAESSLWIACPSEDKVLRINPITNLVDKYIPVSATPEELAFGESSIWVLCRKEGKIDQLDPKTNKVSKTIDLGVPGVSGQIAFGENALWVTLPGFPLTRIDPQTQTVAQQFYGEGGGAIQVGGGFLWLANTRQGTLWKLDPKRVIATLAE
jgi:virginiamycin B lyase